MAIKFKDLKIGDPVYFFYTDCGCEDEKAYTLFEGALSKDTVTPDVILNTFTNPWTNVKLTKHEMMISRSISVRGFLPYSLTLYEDVPEFMSKRPSTNDSIYRTGSFVYGTDITDMRVELNAAIQKEREIVARRLAKVQNQLNFLDNKSTI